MIVCMRGVTNDRLLTEPGDADELACVESRNHVNLHFLPIAGRD